MLRSVCPLPFLFVLLACGSAAAGEPCASETEAKVPALYEFHDVIYPLWHTAWPDRNTAMMKELLPEVHRHVEAIRAAELPGILRHHQDAWNAEVERLDGIVASYDAAAQAEDATALADAVERIHAQFERMVRLIRPLMKEMDAYHVVLYRIYHYDLPEKDLEALRASSKDLAARCDELSRAEVPGRYADRREALAASFTSLCEATGALVETAGGDEWSTVAAAVETVHDRYREAEAVFE